MKKKLWKSLLTDYCLLIAQNPSSLLNLVDHLAERFPKIKCKYGFDKKECETCGMIQRLLVLSWKCKLQRWFNTMQMSMLQ